MVTNKEKNFVSCLLYLHNEEDLIKDVLKQICSVMHDHFEKYEIVCVNDFCTDETVEKIREFLQENDTTQMISLVNLSYYQGVEAAMNAGRDLAVGDFLFEFDSCAIDFDLDLIMKVYRRALEGYDVVAASPKKYIPLTSRLFYMVYNFGSHGQGRLRQDRFRIVSRRAVNRVNQMNAYIPYRKALYANCGLKMDTMLYDNHKISSKNRKKEEMGNRSTLAMDTLIIFTNVLERFSLLLSIVFFAALVVVGVDILYTIFGETQPVEGWLSMMGMLSFGFFMLFVMLTLIFKYLAVILNMNFKRQRYVTQGVEKLTK